MTNTATIADQITTLLAKGKEVQDRLNADGEMSAEDRGEITRITAEVKGLVAKAKQAKSDAELLRELNGLGPIEEAEGVVKDAAAANAKLHQIGAARRFVESAEYKAMVGRLPGGIATDHSNATVSPVDVGSYKGLVTGASDTSAGAFINPHNLGLVAGFANAPTRILDLISHSTTSSDLVRYVRAGAFTNNAAVVPEATTSADIGSGDPAVTAVQAGLKPESDIDFAIVDAPVVTIAHGMGITKQGAADAGQVLGYIRNQLLYGLQAATEYEVMNGSGTSGHFTGLANTTGVLQQAFATDMLTTMRKARTTAINTGMVMPTAWAINPLDAEAIDLLKDGTGRYIGNGPWAVGPRTIWGVPAIETAAVPAGEAWLADWRQAVLWDREQASISITDSHKDWFFRNLLALLAELRAAFGVLNPRAFTHVDLSA